MYVAITRIFLRTQNNSVSQARKQKNSIQICHESNKHTIAITCKRPQLQSSVKRRETEQREPVQYVLLHQRRRHHPRRFLPPLLRVAPPPPTHCSTSSSVSARGAQASSTGHGQPTRSDSNVGPCCLLLACSQNVVGLVQPVRRASFRHLLVSQTVQQALCLASY